jgi:hypothetical protein
MNWAQAVGLAIGAGIVAFVRQWWINKSLARAEEAEAEGRTGCPGGE